MDWLKSLYPEVREVLQSSIPEGWQGLHQILEKLFKEAMIPEAALPLVSCKAVNGDPQDAVHVTAALVALGVCLRIFDDLEDQDKADDLWQLVGIPRAWNYASAIHILAFEILSKAPLSSDLFRQVNQHCIDAFFRIAAGQDRDLAGTTKTIEDYWLTVEMKSACFVTTACTMGAMMGTNDPELIQACGVFGHHLGFALQIFNDMESIWRPKGVTDLQQGKVTLPLLYGLQIDHPGHDELQAIVRANEIAAQEERIKAILDEIDTRGFLIWAALKERDQALAAVQVCPNAEGKEALEAYITGMFGDIDSWLSS